MVEGDKGEGGMWEREGGVGKGSLSDRKSSRKLKVFECCEVCEKIKGLHKELFVIKVFSPASLPVGEEKSEDAVMDLDPPSRGSREEGVCVF
jgi:hypothetical protein